MPCLDIPYEPQVFQNSLHRSGIFCTANKNGRAFGLRVNKQSKHSGSMPLILILRLKGEKSNNFNRISIWRVRRLDHQKPNFIGCRGNKVPVLSISQKTCKSVLKQYAARNPPKKPKSSRFYHKAGRENAELRPCHHQVEYEWHIQK